MALNENDFNSFLDDFLDESYLNSKSTKNENVEKQVNSVDDKENDENQTDNSFLDMFLNDISSTDNNLNSDDTGEQTKTLNEYNGDDSISKNNNEKNTTEPVNTLSSRHFSKAEQIVNKDEINKIVNDDKQAAQENSNSVEETHNIENIISDINEPEKDIVINGKKEDSKSLISIIENNPNYENQALFMHEYEKLYNKYLSAYETLKNDRSKETSVTYDVVNDQSFKLERPELVDDNTWEEAKENAKLHVDEYNSVGALPIETKKKLHWFVPALITIIFAIINEFMSHCWIQGFCSAITNVRQKLNFSTASDIVSTIYYNVGRLFVDSSVIDNPPYWWSHVFYPRWTYLFYIGLFLLLFLLFNLRRKHRKMSKKEIIAKRNEIENSGVFTQEYYDENYFNKVYEEAFDSFTEDVDTANLYGFVLFSSLHVLPYYNGGFTSVPIEKSWKRYTDPNFIKRTAAYIEQMKQFNEYNEYFNEVSHIYNNSKEKINNFNDLEKVLKENYETRTESGNTRKTVASIKKYFEKNTDGRLLTQANAYIARLNVQ